MSEQLIALRRGILANPMDLELRLVFADALDEEGDPVSAAYVRTETLLQREFEKPKYKRELYPMLAQRTAPPKCWFDHRRKQDLKLHWRAGFIRSVVCRYEDWKLYGPGLMAEWPIEEIKIKDRHPHVRRTVSIGFAIAPEYFWDVGYTKRVSCSLDRCIYTLLTGFNRESATTRFYAYPLYAREALHRAAIAWAKAEGRPWETELQVENLDDRTIDAL